MQTLKKKLLAAFSAPEQAIVVPAAQPQEEIAPKTVATQDDLFLLSCLPQPFTLQQAQAAYVGQVVNMEQMIAPFKTNFKGPYNLASKCVQPSSIPDAIKLQYMNTIIDDAFWEPNGFEFSKRMSFAMLKKMQNLHASLASAVPLAEAKILTMLARSGIELMHHDLIQPMIEQAVKLLQNDEMEQAQALSVLVQCYVCTPVPDEYLDAIQKSFKTLNHLPLYDKVMFNLQYATIVMLSNLNKDTQALSLANVLYDEIKNYVSKELLCFLNFKRISLLLSVEPESVYVSPTFQLYLRDCPKNYEAYILPLQAQYAYAALDKCDDALQIIDKVISNSNQNSYDALCSAVSICEYQKSYSRAIGYSKQLLSLYAKADCQKCKINAHYGHVKIASKLPDCDEMLTTYDLLLQYSIGTQFETLVLDSLYRNVKAFKNELDMSQTVTILLKYVDRDMYLLTSTDMSLFKTILFILHHNEATQQIDSLLTKYFRYMSEVNVLIGVIKNYEELIPVYQHLIKRVMAKSSQETDSSMELRCKLAECACSSDMSLALEQSAIVINFIETKKLFTTTYNCYVRALHVNAFAHFASRRPNQAMELCQRFTTNTATFVDPRNIMLFENMHGACLVSLGNAMDAIPHLIQALDHAKVLSKQKPEKYEIYVTRILLDTSHAYFVVQDFDEFVKCFRSIQATTKEMVAAYDITMNYKPYLHYIQPIIRMYHLMQ